MSMFDYTVELFRWQLGGACCCTKRCPTGSGADGEPGSGYRRPTGMSRKSNCATGTDTHSATC
jgi:hypothetical protein